MKRPSTPDLRGNLARFPLDLVLQFLGTARTSGRLSVQHASEAVYVDLAGGRIIGGGREGDAAPADAKIGREQLDAGLVAALGWRTGMFAFAQGAEPPARRGRLDVGVDEVLIGCVSRVDQARRKQAQRV
jgi:hypothetical protein